MHYVLAKDDFFVYKALSFLTQTYPSPILLHPRYNITLQWIEILQNGGLKIHGQFHFLELLADVDDSVLGQYFEVMPLVNVADHGVDVSWDDYLTVLFGKSGA